MKDEKEKNKIQTFIHSLNWAFIEKPLGDGSFSFSATTDKNESHLSHNRQKLFPSRPQPTKIILSSATTDKNYSLPGHNRAKIL